MAELKKIVSPSVVIARKKNEHQTKGTFIGFHSLYSGFFYKNFIFSKNVHFVHVKNSSTYVVRIL